MAPADSLDAVLRRHYGYSPIWQWSQSRLSSPPENTAQTLLLRGRPPQILFKGLVGCENRGQRLEYVESYLRPDVFDVVTEVDKW